MRQLLAKNYLLFNCWTFFAAFSTYFFMYMFRKPFTAAAFETEADSFLDGKSVIVSAQVIGYLVRSSWGYVLFLRCLRRNEHGR